MEQPAIRKIAFNIYAKDDEEAERGRRAVIQFIDLMGQHGAMVSGDKIADAVDRLGESPFIKNQIINFFKKR